MDGLMQIQSCTFPYLFLESISIMANIGLGGLFLWAPCVRCCAGVEWVLSDFVRFCASGNALGPQRPEVG